MAERSGKRKQKKFVKNMSQSTENQGVKMHRQGEVQGRLA